MISNENLTTTMQAFQSREEPERLYAYAGWYWRVMLSIGVVIGTLAFVGGAYMLVMTFLDMSPNRSQGNGPQTLNRDQLARVVAGLRERQELFNTLQGSTEIIPDPSK